MFKQSFMVAALLSSPLWAAADCNNMHVSFKNGYAQTLPNDDPMALVAYVTIVNHDVESHTITGVSSPGVSTINFYGKGGDIDDGTINMIPLEQIRLHPNGGTYQFVPGRSHILLKGYRELPDRFTPIPLTFTFADGCILSTDNVYRRD